MTKLAITITNGSISLIACNTDDIEITIIDEDIKERFALHPNSIMTDEGIHDHVLKYAASPVGPQFEN